jgi:hypothetical protein
MPICQVWRFFAIVGKGLGRADGVHAKVRDDESPAFRRLHCVLDEGPKLVER